jgi:G3E family GTPase
VSSGAQSGALSEEVLELANGCLCCSIKDSGAAAIEKLMQKRGRFDYILLETTGLADPGRHASTLVRDAVQPVYDRPHCQHVLGQ